MSVASCRWQMTSFVLCVLCAVTNIEAFNTVSGAKTQDKPLKSWGPYRPNLYFGIRPTIPETLLFGLMWASGDDRSSMLSTLRDTCEQDDGMEGYGWTIYDPHVGGIQTIHDSTLHLDLYTHFYKTRDGESWTVWVQGIPRDDAPADLKTALVFHAALENAENATEQRGLRCIHHPEDQGKAASRPAVECMGNTPELGSFDIYQVWDNGNKVIHGPAVKTSTVTEDKIWQAKAVYTDAIKNNKEDSMLIDEPNVGNMHFSQIVFEGAFKIFYVYRANAAALIPPESIPVMSLSQTLIFSALVNMTFNGTAPFQDSKYAHFSESLTANLLGGMGFFHGNEKVDYSNHSEYEETDLKFWDKTATAMSQADITTTPSNTSLLSFVPSRPFFPRGFLWDEGFHLLPVLEWDFDLAILVLKNWLSLMDADGWIAREQILGPEARSKVPKEFQTQYPHFANPPTFLSLLLPDIISKLSKKSPYNGQDSYYLKHQDKSQALIRELFPLFERHYNWFRRTQAGNFTAAYPRLHGADTEGYRWRGRTPGHCFTSGLDDYPRAEPPHPGELHVDALAWVGASAEALRQAAEYLGEDSSFYAEQVRSIRHNLDALHWNAKESAYCDATISQNGKYQHTCHLGYVSLMPLLTGHLNDSHPRLPAVLDLLSDPKRLWSSHGIRSLSLTDENYGKGEDYWRGAVWMNLNVLAVLRLRDLGNSTFEGRRAQVIAAKLRRNVIQTVYTSWENTRFAWEQYNDKTGDGQRSRAFTGWTACVLLLMGLEDAVIEPEEAEVQGRVSFAWAIPVASIIILLPILYILRRKGAILYNWVLSRLGHSSGAYRHLGEDTQPLESMNLDDLYDSDSQEEVDNPL